MAAMLSGSDEYVNHFGISMRIYDKIIEAGEMT